MVSNADITAAWARVLPYVRRTPTLTVDGFDLGFPIELKLEHTQHTGSFKPRGAFNTLLNSPVPAAGLVAASGGNHGAAAAYAAHTLGHKARIYVPEMAGSAKISLIRNLGADLILVKGAYSNALEDAQSYEVATGAMQIHAYDAPATVAGQGTCFAEWEDQGLEADTILIAVGGGGLISGALEWFGERRKVVAVEPETCATLYAARKAANRIDVDVSGVAANALGARQIGKICFEVAQANDTQTVLVSDDSIIDAQMCLWREMRQLVEPAGAAALAALTSGAYIPERGERVAVLVCGANIAPDPFG